MSEFNASRRVNTFAAATAAALALVAAGCGSKSSLRMSRCFEKPQPSLVGPIPEQPKRRPHEAKSHFYKRLGNYQVAILEHLLKSTHVPEPMTIHVNDGAAEDDPIYVPTIEPTVDSAIVEVDTSEAGGSGFLVRNKRGELLAVTAAHVIGHTSLQGLKITGPDLQVTHPESGCYLYENDGKFINLTDNTSKIRADIDIAILKLRTNTFDHALDFATKPVKRGQWLDFANFQGQHYPGDPANYTGIVIETIEADGEFGVLSGIRKVPRPIRKKYLEEIEAEPGASGGVVVDLHGKVTGMSIGGVAVNDSSLKKYFNIETPGANISTDNGYSPKVALLVPSKIIKKAVENGNY